jgi:hypothetical protein
MLAMMGVAGTTVGVALAIVRERLDRRTDARAAREAAREQESKASGPDESDSAD